MKKLVKFTALCMFLFVGTSIFSLSDGAFNMTGAPGEGDCSGCHSGVPVNSDPKGSIQISIDSSNGVYIPGKVYDVHVVVSHSLRNRFGFALTTRMNKPTEHVGTFLSATSNDFFNRTDFMAHRRAGIDASQQKKWSFKWKAPDTATQDITFYAAGVAANANNDNTGDIVYTSQVKLKNANTVTSVPNHFRVAAFTVYPNPASTFLVVKSVHPLNKFHHIRLIDVQGKVMETLTYTSLKEQNGEYRIDLNPEYASGLYYLHVNFDNRDEVHKFFITK